MKNIDKIKEKINWDKYRSLPKQDEHWKLLSKNPKLSTEFIREFKDKLQWYYLSEDHDLFSIEFLEKFKNKIDWRIYTGRTSNDLNMSNTEKECFYLHFHDVVDWDYLSDFTHEQFSDYFMSLAKDKFDWVELCATKFMSETFNRNHQDYVFWKNIYKYQRLSPEFKREFLPKLEAEATCFSDLYKRREMFLNENNK